MKKTGVLQGGGKGIGNFLKTAAAFQVMFQQIACIRKGKGGIFMKQRAPQKPADTGKAGFLQMRKTHARFFFQIAKGVYGKAQGIMISRQAEGMHHTISTLPQMRRTAVKPTAPSTLAAPRAWDFTKAEKVRAV